MKHLILFLLVLTAAFSHAGIEPYQQGMIRTVGSTPVDVTVPSSCVSEALLIPSFSGLTHMDLSRKSLITFGVDQHFGKIFSNMRVQITLLVHRDASYSTSGYSSANDTTVTMEISYSPEDSLSYTDRHTILMDGWEKVKVQIQSVIVNGSSQNTLPGNLYVQTDLFFERLHDFTAEAASTTPPSMNAYSLIDIDSDGTDDQIKISWPLIDGAESYQLEWTFVNDYENSFGTSYVSLSDLSLNFRENSTRVTTTDKEYLVTLAFDHGYLFYRVRGVGRDLSEPNKYIFTEWSAFDAYAEADNAPHYFHNTVPFEPTKNWQYSAKYAEEAKKKEVVNFFDGSLRNRQVVTRINSDDNTIVGEMVYDHQGRPAVQILPTPVNTVASTSLKYYENFNRSTSSDPYTRGDFDLSDTTNPCGLESAPLDNSSGAGQYYSPNNPNLADENGYIPDAQGYAYSQIEYTPDNTGRIRRKGGVGKEFQLGSGHETKYFYSHPFQEQLNMMFGSEVGNAAHYQKNMVVDPNGQVSVSYLDQEGRVIATSLAGEAPQNLQRLPSSEIDPLNMDVDLLAKDANGISTANQVDNLVHSIEFSQAFSLSSPSEVTLDYNLEFPIYLDSCMPQACFHCVYDLSLSVKDECGTELLPEDWTDTLVGTLTRTEQGAISFHLHCGREGDPDFGGLITIPTLPTGTYQIVKTLTVSQEAFNYNLKQYLDTNQNPCITPLSEYQEEFLTNVDYTGCDSSISCEQCVAALGTLEDWLANGSGTQANYEGAVKACMAPCEEPSYCETQKAFMLSDLKPGGQYGQYETPAGVYSPGSFPVSIYNSNNVMTVAPDVYHVTNLPHPNWRQPRLRLNTVYVNEFRDEDMVTRSKVEVDVYFNGSGSIDSVLPELYSTPVIGGNLFQDANGEYFTYPENLLNLIDFVHEFKSSWAESFLVYHPEFSYYRTCHSFTNPTVAGETMTSEAFDQLMISCNTWDAAVAHGLIKTGYAGITNTDQRIEDYSNSTAAVFDPFVAHASLFGTYGPAFASSISNYQTIDGVSYSMMDIAAVLTRCSANLLGVVPSATCTRWGDPSPIYGMSDAQIRDAEWTAFKTIYLGAKQKAQLKYSHYLAVNSSDYRQYNGCIGSNGTWNVFAYNFFYPPAFFTSQYFQPTCQPCALGYKTYYYSKIKRFIDPADNPNASDPNYIAYQQYLQTGQCPIASNFEHLLSEIADRDYLEDATPFSLNTMNFTSALYLAISNYNPAGPTPTLSWTQTAMTATTLNANIYEGLALEATIHLNGTFPAGFGWDDIEYFSGLDYTLTNTSGEDEFTLVAHIDMGDSIYPVNFSGSTTYQIGGCTFQETCTPNQLGTELSNLLQGIAMNGDLSSSSPIDVQDNTQPLSAFVTPFIQLAANGSLTSSLYWEYDATQEEFYLYESTSGTGMQIQILNTQPTFNLANISLIATLGPLLPLDNDLFKMACYDGSGNLLTTMTMQAGAYSGNVLIEAFPMGECGLPTPIECEGQPFDNVDLLKTFIAQALTDNGIQSSVPGYAIESSLSSQFAADFTSAAVYTADNDSIRIDIGDCDIILTLDSAATAQGIDIDDILSIVELVPSGEQNNYGVFNTFTVQATFDLSGTTVTANMLGESCLPLQTCQFCAGESQSEGGEENSQLRIANKSVDAYDLYLTEVQALNERLGWISRPEEIIPIGFTDFYDFEVHYNMDEYMRFVANYEPCIDKESYLLFPDVFISEYGQERNLKAEYTRYLNAVSVYNNYADEYSYTPLTAPSIEQFSGSVYAHDVQPFVEQVFPHISPWHPHDPIVVTDPIRHHPGPIADPMISAEYLDSSDCFEMYTAYRDTMLATYAGCDWISPITYEEFLKHNLCCEPYGVAYYEKFMLDLQSVRQGDCKTVYKLPYSKDTCFIASDPESDCYYLYKGYVDVVKAYNTWEHADTNNLLIVLYDNYDWFKQTGKCDCVEEYIRYVDSIMTYDTIPTTLLTLDEYCPTTFSEPDTLCQTAYQDYLNCIRDHNDYVSQHGGTTIRDIVRLQTFISNQLCDCVAEYCALLSLLHEEGHEKDPLPNIMKLCIGVEPPCTPNQPVASSGTLPNIPPVDPCAEMLNSVALANAQAAYEQQIQDLTTHFTQAYYAKCMSAIEDLSMQYQEKEYHRTLYYYDQAGNLIKTVPPEGVELLDVVSNDGELNDKINADRLNGTHNVLTSHRMATRYVYNSLNQLVSQHMPDQDDMDLFEISKVDGLANGLVTTSIQMISSNKGYLTGYVANSSAAQGSRGFLYETANGGKTWTRVNGTVTSNLRSVFMADNNKGFAIAKDGLLLYTANGGLVWDLVDTYGSGIKEDFTAVSGDGSGNVVVSTRSGKLLRMNSTAFATIAQISQLTLPGGSDPIAEVVSMEYGSGNYYASAMLGTLPDTYGVLLNFSSTITTSTTSATLETMYGNTYKAVDYINSTDGFTAGADGKMTVLNDASGYKQTQRSSDVSAEVKDLFMLNDQRGIAILNEGANTRVVWTANGGETWQNPELNPLEDFAAALIDRTSGMVSVALQKNGETKRLVLQATGNISVIDQTPAIPQTLSFTQVCALKDGANTYYYAIEGNNVYVSNAQTASTTPVTYSLIGTGSSLSGVTRLRATKVTGGYMVVASNGTNLLAWRNSAVTGTYTAVTFSASSGSLIDFGIVDNSGTPTAIAYDNTNRQLVRKALTMSASGAVTTITSSGSNWPLAGKIQRISVLANGKVTLAGNEGRIFSVSSDARTVSSATITNRSDFRSLQVNDIAASATSGVNYVAVGKNGTLFNNKTTVPSDMASGWYEMPLNITDDLKATAALTNAQLVGGENGIFFSLDLATGVLSDLETVMATSVTTDLSGSGIHTIITAGNRVYAAGENGKVYFNNDVTTGFYTPLTTSNSATNNGLAFLPNGKAVMSAENGKIYRLTFMSINETKEIFSPKYREVHFDDFGNGTLIGDHFLVRTSTNNGLNWKLNLPSSTTELSTYRNSLLSTWTKRAANGNHFAVIGGNSYFATVSGNAVTSSSYTGNAAEIEFNGSGNTGYITAGSDVNELVLTPVTGAYTVATNFLASAGSAINAIHVFENQSIMMVGSGFVKYYQPSLSAVADYTGSATGVFRDVYFHDDMVGYVVGDAGVFYHAKSASIDAGTHEISGLGYTSETLEDGIVSTSNNTDLNIYAIDFGSRYEGVWGGMYLSGFTPVQNRPYVRTIKDQGGEFSSQFFYDRLGRIVVSRNSRQEQEGKYSYTLYDALGRVFEGGEKTENNFNDPQFTSIFGSYLNGSFVSSVIDDSRLAVWLTTVSGTRNEVTRSYYDNTNTAIEATLPANFTPDPLTQRKRMVHVTYEEIYDGIDDTYDNATHYDYDIHGNVKTLLQDNQKMYNFDNALVDQRFKRMDYVYDQISGNVHRVDFQTNQIDQWHHNYQYDADNRVTDVYTTTSTPLANAEYGTTDIENEHNFNPLWIKEASYNYYAHGPLARTELGEEQVQGLDYVYTLQGWMKGVNSNILNAFLDPGKDGYGGSDNELTARDAHGYSLHYYHDDYMGIGSGTSGTYAKQYDPSTSFTSALYGSSPDLYNGNIARMITTITNPDTREVLPLGNAYNYDQLNRLVDSRSFDNISLDYNSWSSAAGNDMYFNRFRYDANGNITYQGRKDKLGADIDEMTYYYPLDVNGKTIRSQLMYVDDSYDYDSNDINPGMSSSNYQYDEEGRLLSDAQEGIGQIYWRVDGKVKKIKYFTGTRGDITFDYDALGRRIAKHVYDYNTGELVKSTYYSLDLEGNTLSTYEYNVDNVNSTVTYSQEEKYIYGSSRLGVLNETVYLLGSVPLDENMTQQVHIIGQRSYELNNHLNNVLSIVSDKVKPYDDNSDNLIDWYLADIRQSTDYSPFGVTLDGRNFTLSGAENNRYGFNGMEKDDEVKGSGNSYTTEFRQYDPRIGRWLSIDPQYKKFPWQSPYVAFDNNPILLVDPKGLAAEGNGDKLPKNDDGTRSKDNGNGTKTYDAPGFSTITIPSRAKILGSMQDENGNGKIDYNGVQLQASKGDLYKFSVDGVIYTAKFSSGKFMGYYHNDKKYSSPSSGGNTSGSSSTNASFTGLTSPIVAPVLPKMAELVTFKTKVQTQYEEKLIDGPLGDKVSVVNFSGSTLNVYQGKHSLATFTTTKTVGGNTSYSVSSLGISLGVSGLNSSITIGIPFTNTSLTYGSGPGVGLGETQLGFVTNNADGTFQGSRVVLRPGGGTGLAAVGVAAIVLSDGFAAPIVLPILKWAF